MHSGSGNNIGCLILYIIIIILLHYLSVYIAFFNTPVVSSYQEKLVWLLLCVFRLPRIEVNLYVMFQDLQLG